jgi:hypothetical protein
MIIDAESPPLVAAPRDEVAELRCEVILLVRELLAFHCLGMTPGDARDAVRTLRRIVREEMGAP